MEQIDKLILCSPYREPHLHWERGNQTQKFLIKKFRRPAGHTIAIPQSKTGIVIGEFIELPLVNLIRKRIKEWKADNPASPKTCQIFANSTKTQNRSA